MRINLQSEIEAERCRAIDELAGSGNLSAVILLVDQLEKEGSFYVRRRLIQALGGIKRSETGLIVGRLFLSSQAHVRNSAMEVLQALQECSLPTIEALMLDPSRDIRKLSVDVLDKISGEKAFELLIQGLKDSDLVIVSACAEALGRKKDQRALAPLLELLHKSTNVWMSFSIIEASAKLGDPLVLHSLYQHIVQMWWGKEDRILLFGIWVHTLGELGDHRWLTKVWEMLQNKELSEDAIIELLLNFSRRGILWEADSTILEEILNRQFQQTEFSKRIQIAHLALVKCPRLFYQFLPILITILKDEEELLDEFLPGIIKEKPSKEQFTELFAEANDELIMLLLKLSQETQTPVSLEIIKDLINRKDSEIVRRAASIAWQCGSAAELLLQGMINHNDPEVVVEAIHSLGLLGRELTVSFYLNGLINPDEMIRRRSVEVICKSPQFRQVDEIEGMIKDSPLFSLPEILEVMAVREHSGLEQVIRRIGDVGDEISRAKIAKSARLINNEEQFLTVMKLLSNDPDQEVRRQVILSLSSHSGNAIYSLLRYLFRYEKSSVNRYHILACPEIYRHSQTMDWLQEAIQGTDPLLQWAAAKALGEMGDAGQGYLQEIYEVAKEKDESLAEIIHQVLVKNGGQFHDADAGTL